MKEQKTEMPGFGMYFLAAFLTPVYYAKKGKWLAFAVTGALYTAAFFTMPLLGFGIVPWMIAATPACWDARNEIIVAQAKRIGEETAEATARLQGN